MALATSAQHAQINIPTTPAPSFWGLLRGELYKITRFRTTWFLLSSPFLILIFFWLGSIFLTDRTGNTGVNTLSSIFQNATGTLSLLRIFSGFVLIILTARLIGLDYQQGTIRIILARGVGRLQLLTAKLLAMSFIALVLLVAGIVLDGLLCLLAYQVFTGSISTFHVLTWPVWRGLLLYILTVAISMEVTILLTLAVAVLGRSVAVGVGVGLGFFAADNVGVGIMFIISRLTRNDFWIKLTGYFLGPNLNVMPVTWLGTVANTTIITPNGEQFSQPVTAISLGTGPLIDTTTTQIFLVTLAYAILFFLVAYGLTWRRDVLE